MRVLLATEGSKCSHTAIDKFAELFRNSELVIKLVSVENTPPPAAEPYTGQPGIYTDAEEILREHSKEAVIDGERKIRELFGEKVSVESEVLIGSPARRIVEEAQNWKADLIVAGSHGYGFWERMMLGSVSQSIAQHAPCSVLIVRGEKNSS